MSFTWNRERIKFLFRLTRPSTLWANEHEVCYGLYFALLQHRRACTDVGSTFLHIEWKMILGIVFHFLHSLLPPSLQALTLVYVSHDVVVEDWKSASRFPVKILGLLRCSDFHCTSTVVLLLMHTTPWMAGPQQSRDMNPMLVHPMLMDPSQQRWSRNYTIREPPASLHY